ncbi:hypothetical protein [Mycobacterium tuberculosis]|uniref:hypothetical protein n=1 Tax=Mycobacterium tuberculosis TaxID=1773 RepID=UPI00126010E5|nr:hypothetical protein [Mycobacterium tuberculosis]
MALASIGLRAQLRLMAAATGARPMWATMTVAGPSRFVGRDGVLWFEWAASVTVSGGWDAVDDNTLDHLVPTLREEADAEQTDTARLNVPRRLRRRHSSARRMESWRNRGRTSGPGSS